MEQTTTKLSGWIGNRVDSPTEIEVTDELAREFLASHYYDAEFPMVRRMVPVWLASKDGRNIAWENTAADLDAIDDLVQRIRRLEDAA